MNVVPRRNTPIEPRQILDLLRSRWRDVFDTGPTRAGLGLVLALALVETGRGKKVQNNNLGGITASENFPGDAFRPPWFDFEGGTAVTDRNIELHELMRQGKAPKAFRAYSTPELGALDFLRQLRGLFPEVLAAAETGQPETFRLALGEKYSKDYLAKPEVTDTFRKLVAEFSPLLVDLPDGNAAPGPGLSRGVGVAVALTIAAAGVSVFVLTLRPPKALRRAA